MQAVLYGCLSENTISIVERLARKPHWDSGYALSAGACSQLRTTLGKGFERNPTIVVAVTAVAHVLLSVTTFASFHILGHCSFIPALLQELRQLISVLKHHESYSIMKHIEHSLLIG